MAFAWIGAAIARDGRWTTRAAGTAVSRTTCAGSRSITIPLKAGWRSRSSLVHSANSAVITMRGSTQRASGKRRRVCQRRGLAAERLHRVEQLATAPAIDAAAHLPGVPQLPRLG